MNNRFKFKKIFLLLVSFFVCLFYFLNFSYADEKISNFEKEFSDRDYIVLNKQCSFELKSDWSAVFRNKTKIKILKDSAKDLGELSFNYNKSKESINVISAYTITTDGKKYQYSKIQDFNLIKENFIYSDDMVKVITMPEVNVGSIIEYEYEKVSKGMVIDGVFWDLQDFNFNFPVLNFKVSFVFPKKCRIAYKEINLKYKPVIKEDADSIGYFWNLKELAPKQSEDEFMPLSTIDNLENVIEFSSIKSWDDFAKIYYSLVQKNFKVTSEISQIAQLICKDKITVKDKVRVILEYIQDNYRYVGMSFGINAYEPHSTDIVFNNKFGDCKDLSLLCMSMLQAVGIDSNIVLFNQEDEISDPQYHLPLFDLFDHAIVLVKDKTDGDFYIDPLLKGYDISEFPNSYMGAYVFIVSKGGGRFDRLPIFDEKINFVRVIENIILFENGHALVEVERNLDLSDSIEWRNDAKGLNSKTIQEFFKKQFVKDNKIVINSQLENIENKYGVVKGRCKYLDKNFFVEDKGFIIFEVGIAPYEFEFQQTERKNSFFYRLNSLHEKITTYKIPSGFKVLYLPSNIEENIGFYELKTDFKEVGDNIVIKQFVRCKRSEYPKEDYLKFKNFFAKLSTKKVQHIVLQKK